MRKFSRTSWKPEELVLLRAVYSNHPKPDSETISSIAVILEKRPRTIKIWFQNARQRNLNMDVVDCVHALFLESDALAPMQQRLCIL